MGLHTRIIQAGSYIFSRRQAWKSKDGCVSCNFFQLCPLRFTFFNHFWSVKKCYYWLLHKGRGSCTIYGLGDFSVLSVVAVWLVSKFHVWCLNCIEKGKLSYYYLISQRTSLFAFVGLGIRCGLGRWTSRFMVWLRCYYFSFKHPRYCYCVCLDWLDLISKDWNRGWIWGSRWRILW